MHSKPFDPEWKISKKSAHYEKMFFETAGEDFDALWDLAAKENEFAEAGWAEPEHVSEARIPQKVWKHVLRKMQRNKFSKNQAKSFLYAKLSDTIPRFGSSLDSKEKQRLRAEMEEAFNAEKKYIYIYIYIHIHTI